MQVFHRRSPSALHACARRGRGADVRAGEAHQAGRDALPAKLAQIEKNADRRRARAAPRAPTQVTDAEVNSYLKFLAGSQVPVGIVDPHAPRRRQRPRDRARDRRSRRRAHAEEARLDRSARLPDGTAAGHRRRNADHDRMASAGSRWSRREISGVTIPKSLLQELLSYYSTHAGELPPASTWTSRSSCRPPSARSGSVKGTAVDRPMNGVADPLQGSLQYPERGRTAPRGRSPARRPLDRRRSPVPLSDALRGSRALPDHRVAEARRVGVGVGRGPQLRHPSDAAAALQDLRDAAARSDRQPARRLVQPAVPEGRLPSASARHPLRQARADVARPADAEPAVRDSRSTSRSKRTKESKELTTASKEPSTPGASCPSTRRPGS